MHLTELLDISSPNFSILVYTFLTVIKSNGGNSPCSFLLKLREHPYQTKILASNFAKTVSTFSSFRLKACIKSCSGAAASAFNMPWKNPPINSSENVAIGAGSFWIPSVIQPLVAKLSFGLIKTLF